jgi:hypothetical protein
VKGVGPIASIEALNPSRVQAPVSPLWGDTQEAQIFVATFL